MTQISINYAIVLYQLGVSKEDIRYSKELFEAADALYESLASPVVTLHEKYVVIDRLFPESMRAFFKVLCRNQSVSLIDEISRHTAIMQTNRKMFCVQSCSMWKTTGKAG